ncbi:MAG TPA: hypothetical protein VFH63_08660 [candidate division Zixibacteria bacterium]|nr:hypothetical protein [candidate division Zixibacteria bacterium]
MSPWLLLTALVAVINLAVFVLIRGRWGRIVPVLAGAALIGSAAGDLVGGATRLELLTIGDYHAVAASVGAQLAMLVSVLVAAMLPERGERRDESERGGR